MPQIKVWSRMRTSYNSFFHAPELVSSPFFSGNLKEATYRFLFEINESILIFSCFYTVPSECSWGHYFVAHNVLLHCQKINHKPATSMPLDYIYIYIDLYGIISGLVFCEYRFIWDPKWFGLLWLTIQWIMEIMLFQCLRGLR